MHSQKLINTFEQHLMEGGAWVLSGFLWFRDLIVPEPLTIKYTETKCPIQDSVIRKVLYNCEGAIASYPQFISGLSVWGIYYAIFTAQQMRPIIAFEADFDDLRMHLAIDSLPYSKISKALIGIGHILTLATFALAMWANSLGFEPNEGLVTAAFFFVITNALLLSSFGKSEFDISLDISEIKTKWPHKVQCSPPSDPQNRNVFSNVIGLVYDQSTYFSQLVRSLHPNNHFILKRWGNPEEIVPFMATVLSREGAGDVPNSSKAIPFPFICKVSVFCVTLAVGYQSFLQVQEYFSSSNTKVVALDDAMAVRLALAGDDDLDVSITQMTNLLPFVLPGENASSILKRDTVTFFGHRSKCYQNMLDNYGVEGEMIFQMSPGICKPIQGGRSISYIATNTSSTQIGTLNLYSGTSCQGTVSRAILVHALRCYDDPLDQIIPFEEPSDFTVDPVYSASDASDAAYHQMLFEKRLSKAFSVIPSPAFSFTNADVGVQLKPLLFEESTIDLGRARYSHQGDPYVIAGEQRIAACMQSEPSCFSAVKNLYQRNLPRKKIVKWLEGSGSCAPKVPYSTTESTAFSLSPKHSLFKVPVSSLTLQCMSNSPSIAYMSMLVLWALYLATVVFIISWQAKRYSPADFRFFIALELGIVMNRRCHLHTIGQVLALTTFAISCLNAVTDGLFRAILYLFAALAAINAMFTTIHSVDDALSHAEDYDKQTSRLTYATKLESILNDSSPVSFKLPHSRISISELNGILIKTVYVLKKLELSLLKDELCNSDSLNTWGDGAAIAEILKNIFSER
jgi:hypothetical protein